MPSLENEPAATAPAQDARKLNIAATGYVSTTKGSVSGANGIVLRELLRRVQQLTFHSKAGFADPRSAIEGCDCEDRLRYHHCDNGLPGAVHDYLLNNRLRGLRSLSPLTAGLNRSTYQAEVARSIRGTLSSRVPPDVVLWLGRPAYFSIPGVPTVSWAQGPPGTDARSIDRHADEIRQLGGRALLWKLRAYAKWRLGPGLPPHEHSDHLIVGSEWSRRMMRDRFGFDENRLHALPYPIDLELFTPSPTPRTADGPLRVLWLGRIVPRKRLDLFLDGMALAIRQGVDARATVIGGCTFVPNYERLIDAFEFRDRIARRPGLPRAEVPALMAEHDVLAQPSDEENFGSSVAEALACGVPTIVGATNGTGDYICDRSIRLPDDSPEAFAAAIASLADAKRAGALVDPAPSRRAAVEHCAPQVVVSRLEAILRRAIEEGPHG